MHTCYNSFKFERPEGIAWDETRNEVAVFNAICYLLFKRIKWKPFRHTEAITHEEYSDKWVWGAAKTLLINHHVKIK